VTSPPRSSALTLLAEVPFYRGAAAALFLSGLGFSAAAPQIATFLVRELDASLTTAGLYYLTNLTAPVAGYLIGARSDRTGKRLGLFRLCAAIGGLGWAGIALSTQLWMPFVLSALALAVAGAATSQLFAALHDELAARPSPANDGVVAIVRMALTAGWVIGPVLGTVLAAQVGSRGMLLATAAATLAQIVPLGLHRERGAAPHGEGAAGEARHGAGTAGPAGDPGRSGPAGDPVGAAGLEGALDGAADGGAAAVGADGGAALVDGPVRTGGASRADRAPGADGARGTSGPAGGRPGLAQMLPLLAFTAQYVCVYAGESIKYAYLPLHMSGDLQLPAAVSGAVIGVQPLVELVLMPFAVVAGRRFGMLRLMVVGAAAGVAANLLFALSGSVIGLFAGQVLMGGVWGVFAVLGIIVAQRLLPGAVATASAVFLSSTAISSALGGALGGIGAGVIGLPLVFLLPAVLGVVAVAGLLVMDRRLRGQVETAP
jgi:SET family sugar efflux transporter-like MFS transporter